jgi:DNA polymerase (family 10)
MENYEIAEVLTYTAKLMELHNGNAFKIRSYQNAAFKIDRISDIKLEEKSATELEAIDGIGKSLSTKIHQLIATNTFPELQQLIDDTPPGVIQMMKIKGIGPKKVALLWKELGIETPGELLYACNENRLIELKGFGAKTQEQVRKAIEFTIANQGYFHYAYMEQFAHAFMQYLSDKKVSTHFSTAGALRRKLEVLSVAEFIIGVVDDEKAKAIELIRTFPGVVPESIKVENGTVAFKNSTGINATVLLAKAEHYFYELWVHTGNPEHIALCTEGKDSAALLTATSEEAIYATLGLSYIEPELREGREEVQWSKENRLPTLVNIGDLKGILHNHTTYSDGIHTLEEMAKACRDAGYEYLGICDHSKSAFYANGLSAERVADQQKAMDALNAKMAPFRIFKGIESDILHDGSLDYPEEVLATFDFIVASVHSGLKMDEEKATQRLITAIRNPFTTILGHPTGRLLLAREAYPIDHKAVIDACAEEGVIIELNAHPYRLDLDWRWIQYALSKGVKISINPDAHAMEGYGDMYYGVCAARKGGLSAEMTFNALSLNDINRYFEDRKQRALK